MKTFVPGEITLSMPQCELSHLGVPARAVTQDVCEKPHSRPVNARKSLEASSHFLERSLQELCNFPLQFNSPLFLFCFAFRNEKTTCHVPGKRGEARMECLPEEVRARKVDSPNTSQ